MRRLTQSESKFKHRDDKRALRASRRPSRVSTTVTTGVARVALLCRPVEQSLPDDLQSATGSIASHGMRTFELPADKSRFAVIQLKFDSMVH